MLRSLLLSALFASAAVMAQPINTLPQRANVVPTGMNLNQLGIGSGAVLPQNYQQPITGQLTQPVLTPQQAMALLPNDALQAQLNQRVLQAGQTGVMPPANYGALGLGGVQQPVVQQQPQLQFQQQQQPFIGGMQQGLGLGVGGVTGFQQQPFVGGLGIGSGIQQQQQQPFAGGVQPGFGGVGIQQVQQQPWTQQLGVGAGVLPQQQLGSVGFGSGVFPQQVQQPFGFSGVQQQPGGIIGMQQPLGIGAAQQWPQQQQQFGLGVQQQQQPLLGLSGIPQQQFGGIQQGFIQQQQPINFGGMGGAPIGFGMGPM